MEKGVHQQSFSSSRVGSEQSRNSSRRSDYSMTSNNSQYTTKTYAQRCEPKIPVAQRNLASRRKDIPLTDEIIYEPRFKRAFDDDLPKDYAQFAKLSLKDRFPNYHFKGYKPPAKKEMNDEQFKKWVKSPFEEKLKPNLSYFARRPMGFWLSHHHDPAVNDREYLSQMEQLDSETKAKWGHFQKSLRDKDEDCKTIDWPIDLTEEEYAERDARLRSMSLPRIIIPSTDSLRKTLGPSIKGKLGDVNKLLEVREYILKSVKRVKRADRAEHIPNLQGGREEVKVIALKRPPPMSPAPTPIQTRCAIPV